MKSVIRVLICITLAVVSSAQTKTDEQRTVGEQTTVEEFWRTPGEEIRDQDGKLIYAEIKDPKTFTIRVLNDGTWRLHRFAPNTTKLLTIEAGSTVEDLIYDHNGDWDGVTVRSGKLKLTLRNRESRRRPRFDPAVDRDTGVISADGMKQVALTRDKFGRDVNVTYGNDTVATIDYLPSGHVAKIRTGDVVLAFDYGDGAVTETLRVNGRELHKRTVTATTLSREVFPFSFDAVADRVGGADWGARLKWKRSATGTLVTFSKERDEPVATMVQFDSARSAYDADGKPLFYDIALDYNDVGSHVLPYRGIIPNRLVITAEGETGLYLDSPADGAISSVWTAQRKCNFQIFHASEQPRAVVDTGAVVAKFRLQSHLLWQCGVIEKWVCDSSGASGYCYNYYDPVYCDGSSGGGGGDGSTSGGGSTQAGNQVVGDAQLNAAVGRALNSAKAKLGNTGCSEDLFTKVANGTGTTLNLVLQQKGTTSPNWFSGLTFKNGAGVKDSAGKIPCNSSVDAWTRPNSTTVYVCTHFTSSGTGDTLIHEELHTLGLQERPQYPNAAMTSPEIQAFVRQHCS